MNTPRFEVFPRWKQDVEHEPDGFGWRLRAVNGKIVATSGEGFTREADAVRAIGDALGAAVFACGLSSAVIGNLAKGLIKINVLNTDDEPQTVAVSYVREG